MALLVEFPNGSLKQYYYDVIKELYNIRRDEISTTESFYYDVLSCYEKMLDINECVDELVEMQGENEWSI